MTGWGNFWTTHTKAMSDLPDGAVIVELGVAFGRGIETMVKTARLLNRKFRIVGIDGFAGTPGEDLSLYGSNFCLQNTIDGLAGVGVERGDYEIIVGDTADSAKLFDQAHYVFLDADHSYAGVMRDLNAWWPLVAKGGYIGGHDWEFSTVSSAVRSMFPSPQIIEKQCWLQRKE